jgi:energy-coupling factor transporter ATP-binding protein EcfA2
MSTKFNLLKKLFASLPAGIPLAGAIYESFVSKLDKKEKHELSEQIKNFKILKRKKSYLEVINELDLRHEDIIEKEKLDQLLESFEATSESNLLSSDPAAFYSGGAASPGDIAANLDVLRTQYIGAWTDIQGAPQKAWKSLLFKEAKKTLQKKKSRFVIIYGHRGSGKTTLCRRMSHDLKESSIPVIDLIPNTLSLEHVEDISNKLRAEKEKCVHIFTKIEDIHDVMLLQNFKTSLNKLLELQIPFTIYLTIDTNKWRQIELKIGNTVKAIGYILESRHLRGSLDEAELSQLVLKLKANNCLFRLKHKPEGYILYLFRKKAKKGLLTSLIEATRGIEEGQELSDIIWQEFETMSERAKFAYGLVALFGAFGIKIPFSIMEKAMANLTGDQCYFESTAFNAETAEIIWHPRSVSYSTRNRLVAETLLQRMDYKEWEGFKYKILFAALNSIDVELPLDYSFYTMTLDRKVFRVIKDLDLLIQSINDGTIRSIHGHDISRAFNSIIRIYQGRNENLKGKYLSDDSLRHWNHIGNQAYYLKAFCCYYLEEYEDAKSFAIDLIEAVDYPFHMLHGVVLLCLLKEWNMADKALKNFEKHIGSDCALYPNYHELRKEVDIRLSVDISTDDIESLTPALALDKIEQVLVNIEANERDILEQYKKLVRRKHDFFRGYLSFFSYLHSPRLDEDDSAALERYRILSDECKYHLGQHEDHYLNYPTDVRSLLHSNLARSLYKIDYILKNEYEHRDICEDNFQQAIRLKPDNLYACNWYGTFLKDVRKDRENAKIYYQRAIAGDNNNPLFKYNLSLLYYEDEVFSRYHLQTALKLAETAKLECTAGSHWENFTYFIDDLMQNISLLLERNNIKDGDYLEPDDTSEIDL